MKKINLLLSMLLAGGMMASAQQINGDLNHDGKLNVTDVAATMSTILGTKDIEYISGGETDHYAVDNSKVVGTWWLNSQKSITFKSDGTTDYATGYTYKFRPCLGKISIYDTNGKVVAFYDVLDFSSSALVLANNGVVYNTSQTKPTPTTGTETYTANGVSFNMVLVEGGTFKMGGTTEQGTDAQSNELPTHSVTLSNYSIGETEVTQGLWYAVMGTKPWSSPAEVEDWTAAAGVGDNYPVYNVTYTECKQFITKLNSLTGQTFRLPTEAEWEFAARGGNLSKGYKYAGSSYITNVAWYSGNSSKTSHIVGKTSPNELGIYDMSGNVNELVNDWYSTYTSAAQTNPTGPTDGSMGITRGGSWYDAAIDARVSARHSAARGASAYCNYVGFRIAK